MYTNITGKILSRNLFSEPGVSRGITGNKTFYGMLNICIIIKNLFFLNTIKKIVIQFLSDNILSRCVPLESETTSEPEISPQKMGKKNKKGTLNKQISII